MTPHDHKILFNAFAFLAFVLKDEVADATPEKVRDLAALFERYCLDAAGPVDQAVATLGATLDDLGASENAPNGETSGANLA